MKRMLLKRPANDDDDGEVAMETSGGSPNVSPAKSSSEMDCGAGAAKASDVKRLKVCIPSQI